MASCSPLLLICTPHSLCPPSFSVVIGSMLRIVHVDVCGLFAAFFLLHFPAFVANLSSLHTSLLPSMSMAIPSSSLPSFARSGPDIVDFNETCNASTSVLPVQSKPTVASAFTASQTVSILYDNVVRSCGVRIRSSCFSLDEEVVNHLLQMHGLVPCEGSSYGERQYTILWHLLMGDCFCQSEHNVSLPSRSCSNIVRVQLCMPYASAGDLSVAFICWLLDDLTDDQKPTSVRLSAIASAFLNPVYSSYCFSSPAHVRRDTLRLFKRFLKGEVIDSLHVLPSKLETMSKDELQSFTHSHSLQFDCKTSTSDLWNLILDHILTAQCLQAVNVNNWDCSPSGCAQSMKLFLSNVMVETNALMLK